MISPTSTLGELVTAHPSLARELERRDLDYCCGGRRSLADACTEAGLDVDAVVTELTDLADPGEAEPAWATMDMAELADHLEATHHRYLWHEMPRLAALLDKIVAVHGARHPELEQVRACYDEIRADLEPHLMKEERILFPMIRELADAGTAPSFHCGSVANPISVMMREHDVVGDLLARLREQTGDYRTPADGCASYQAAFDGLAHLEADTHLHVHKENNVLFPQVVERERQLVGSG